MESRLLSPEGVRFVLSRRKREVGRGATAVVNIVRWRGRIAVLKRMKATSGKEFFNEISILKLLCGAGGAPELIGLSYEPPMILMSYRGSRTLLDIFHEMFLPDSLILLLGLEVARSLQEVHSVGVIHNDLKNDNVMVVMPDSHTQCPQVSLIDFGLACHQGSSLGLRLSHEASRFFWLAPEVLEGGVSTQRSDIYSLGILLEELMSFTRSNKFKRVLGSICRRTTVQDAALRPSLKVVMEDLSEGLLTLASLSPLPSYRRPSPPVLPHYFYAHCARSRSANRSLRKKCGCVWYSLLTAFYSLLGKLSSFSSCCRIRQSLTE